MEKLTADKALELLIRDVIHSKEELKKPENRWVKHCIFVAIAAGRIAEKLGLDVDYAISLGYIHDIGRKIKHDGHPIFGYQYMMEAGYSEEARSCLTHSFVNNDVNLTAGGPLISGTFDFINAFLQSVELTPYDNIVQMCDLFCLETGFTTVEKRMLDISVRKGVFDNSLQHFEAVMNLKEKLESQMGCELYSLFPEIKQEDLDNVEEDHNSLIKLLHSETPGTDPIKLNIKM